MYRHTYIIKFENAIVFSCCDAKDVFDLTCEDIDGGPSGESSSQRLRHVDSDKTQPKHTHSKLRETEKKLR